MRYRDAYSPDLSIFDLYLADTHQKKPSDKLKIWQNIPINMLIRLVAIKYVI